MIKIFITGGTFDKSYDYINGKLFFEKTHLPEMIKRSKCRLDIEIETIVMKDSLDLTTKDVSMIVDSCKNEKSNRIIITHGTDTITNTAKLISNQKLIDKTIILTGAMIPYAFGSSSDGFFNLGSALSFVQTLKNGVYISINGQYFDFDKVRKNIDKGYFEIKNS